MRDHSHNGRRISWKNVLLNGVILLILGCVCFFALNGKAHLLVNEMFSVPVYKSYTGVNHIALEIGVSCHASEEQVQELAAWLKENQLPCTLVFCDKYQGEKAAFEKMDFIQMAVYSHQEVGETCQIGQQTEIEMGGKSVKWSVCLNTLLEQDEDAALEEFIYPGSIVLYNLDENMEQSLGKIAQYVKNSQNQPVALRELI